MSSHCIILFIKMLTRKFVVRRTASIPATVLRTNQSHVTSRQHLRSATRQSIVVPRHQLSSYGRRAFCVAGPSVWNFVPDSLRDPIIGRKSFRQSLKTFLFATYWCIQHIRGFTTMRYINRHFTYLGLLTYFTWSKSDHFDGRTDRNADEENHVCTVGQTHMSHAQNQYPPAGIRPNCMATGKNRIIMDRCTNCIIVSGGFGLMAILLQVNFMLSIVRSEFIARHAAGQQRWE